MAKGDKACIKRDIYTVFIGFLIALSRLVI